MRGHTRSSSRWSLRLVRGFSIVDQEGARSRKARTSSRLSDHVVSPGRNLGVRNSRHTAPVQDRKVGGGGRAIVTEIRGWGRDRHFRRLSPHDTRLERQPATADADSGDDDPLSSHRSDRTCTNAGCNTGEGAGTIPPHRLRPWARRHPQGLHERSRGWASQGFVVAAPLFPLSNGNVSGGPDAGDVVNQPEDMSYVISSVVVDSQLQSGTLSGLVNAHEIGAAGHSNGAVTTLGLVANTCCYDSAVKAAVVMAGTTEGFPPGHYELTKAPPLLLVHGTADQLIPYRSAPLIYNQARGPKGLLTLVEGSHDAAGGQDPRSAETVIRTTTDFFEAYLTGSRQARSRLTTDGRSPTTKIVVDLTPGSRG